MVLLSKNAYPYSGQVNSLQLLPVLGGCAFLPPRNGYRHCSLIFYLAMAPWLSPNRVFRRFTIEQPSAVPRTMPRACPVHFCFSRHSIPHAFSRPAVLHSCTQALFQTLPDILRFPAISGLAYPLSPHGHLIPLFCLQTRTQSQMFTSDHAQNASPSCET